MKHKIVFRPSGRGKAQCPPDPNYPNGIAIDVCEPAEEGCVVPLPYPAPECGLWLVLCSECDMSVGITAVGRPDDPVSVKIPCRKQRSIN